MRLLEIFYSCGFGNKTIDCLLLFCRSVSVTSILDHLIYYGIDLRGRASFCGIVMDPRVKEYGRTDVEGNFVLSRDPASPILKRKTDMYAGGNHV